jgi:uncharacterized protein
MTHQNNPLNSASTKKIAVIGSGIAGLSAAYHLAQAARAENLACYITLFEADKRLGGHAHTVDVSAYGKTFPVDTGFLVFNHKTYPGLTPFFESLGVVTVPSDMGFSVQVKAYAKPNQTLLEWAGNSLASVFSQRKNIFNPRFWWMLKDLLRFNKAATHFALNPPNSSQTLGEYLATNHH